MADAGLTNCPCRAGIKNLHLHFTERIARRVPVGRRVDAALGQKKLVRGMRDSRHTTHGDQSTSAAAPPARHTAAKPHVVDGSDICLLGYLGRRATVFSA